MKSRKKEKTQPKGCGYPLLSPCPGLLFPTQEIGSIGKPNWLVRKLRGKELSESDWNELIYWLSFAGIKDYEELKELLAKKELTEADRTRLTQWSSILVLKCFEKIGLDIIYDGEQQRTEMYQEPVTYIQGFKFLGEVRSFDNKYYRKAACIDQPKLTSQYHLAEFNFVQNQTKTPLKVPITGAYTLMNWSFNEYYLKKWRRLEKNRSRARYKANQEFAVDLAKQIIQPNIAALGNAGAKMIQIDEPAATTKPDEIEIFVNSFNESTKGFPAIRFNLHICFSDYSLLYPAINRLKNCCQFTFEFANQGTAFDFLKLMKKHQDQREVGLGVLDVHTDEIETPEIIRQRIKAAAQIIEPERIYVNPDCGLRTRSWRIAFAKLGNMMKAVEKIRKEYS
jgi:5-methyltetrahydropteroyltriglutamate--homocysteine methyltransferase